MKSDASYEGRGSPWLKLMLCSSFRLFNHIPLPSDRIVDFVHLYKGDFLLTS